MDTFSSPVTKKRCYPRRRRCSSSKDDDDDTLLLVHNTTGNTITTTTSSSSSSSAIDNHQPISYDCTDDASNNNILDENDAIDSIIDQDRQQQQQEVLLHQFQQHALLSYHHYLHRQHTNNNNNNNNNNNEYAKKKYALRISASNVAAICGYHPYKNVPELLLYQHVYQGSVGQLLLQQDTQLLDINLISPTQQLRDLANKVGTTDMKQMVETVIDIQRGVTKIPTIETATAMTNPDTNPLWTLAQTKLSSSEYTLLYHGIRDHVNTGYGIQWEDNALDLYEQQIGYKVEQRNDEICTWSFALSSSSSSSSSTSSVLSNNDPHINVTDRSDTTTVYPIRRKRYRRSPYSSSSSSSEPTPSVPLNTDSKEAKETTSSSEVEVVVQKSVSLSNELNETENEKEGDVKIVEEIPYFSIVGSVDGIREEMAPVSPSLHQQHQHHVTEKKCDDKNQDIDDEDWEVRQIIVECKHRMKRVCPVPPLYEQIQASIYCLMYDIQYADIVQILRTTSTKPPNTTTTTVTSPITTIIPNGTGTNTENTLGDINSSKIHGTGASSDNPPATLNSTIVVADDSCPDSKVVTITKETNATKCSKNNHKNNDPDIVIAVHRLNVDDPILQHRTHFYQTLIPRLQQFTQVVYDLRHNDHERYTLLHAVATNGHFATAAADDDVNTNATTSTTINSNNGSTRAWDLVLQKCPWLQDCVDIADVQRRH